jgi:hypothetical protein
MSASSPFGVQRGALPPPLPEFSFTKTYLATLYNTTFTAKCNHLGRVTDGTTSPPSLTLRRLARLSRCARCLLVGSPSACPSPIVNGRPTRSRRKGWLLAMLAPCGCCAWLRCGAARPLAALPLRGPPDRSRDGTGSEGKEMGGQIGAACGPRLDPIRSGFPPKVRGENAKAEAMHPLQSRT